MKSSVFCDITPCSHAGFLLGLFFYYEHAVDTLPKRRFTFNGLHSFMFQNIDFKFFTQPLTEMSTRNKNNNVSGE
jgi:hypothetical protein